MGYRRRPWRGQRSRRMRLTGQPRRPVTAWWRPGNIALSQVLNSGGTAYAQTTLMAAADVLAQPSAVLDRKTVIRVLRVICRVILAVTGAGNAGTLKASYGFRGADLTVGASTPATAIDVRLSTASDKREDWWYRYSQPASVAAADAVKLVPIGEGGENTLTLDFKPNRKLEYGQGLVFCYGLTALAGLGAGSAIDGWIEPEILIAGVS